MEAVQFGDVIRLDERLFVFMAQTEKNIYLARILDDHEKLLVENRTESRDLDRRNRLFCYVILETDEYRDRMAHFGVPQYPSDGLYYDKVNRLCDEDVKKLKDEIVSDISVAPSELKENVRSLDI